MPFDSGLAPAERLRLFIHHFLGTGAGSMNRPEDWQHRLMLREMIAPDPVLGGAGPRGDPASLRARSRGSMAEICPEADDRRLNALVFSVIGQCLHYKMARRITERLIGDEGYGSSTSITLPTISPRSALPRWGSGLRSMKPGNLREQGRNVLHDREVMAMYWIALKMLVGDKAKFLGIVMGLTFAAALITQQGSIFCGLMLRTCAQITDITGADSLGHGSQRPVRGRHQADAREQPPARSGCRSG